MDSTVFRRIAAIAVALAAVALGVPAAAQAATPLRAPSLQTFELPSRFVDPARFAFNTPPGAPARPKALRVNVLLPAGYDGRRRFPVLYLLHGHGDAYDSWMSPHQGDLLRTAAGLAAIVVMPEGARGWYANWWDGGARGADHGAWERYHLDELVPAIERRYRIAPGRSQHAIAGLSMGGLGALFYAEQRPGYFGAAASFSGAISFDRPEWPTAFDTQGEAHADVYGDPQAQRFYWDGHDPTKLVGNLSHTRVFVRVGDGVADLASYPDEASNWFGALAEVELRQQAQDFVGAAKQAGVGVRYEPVGGIHDWPYWRDALRSAIAWGLFRPVDEAPDRWHYATVAQTGRAWNVRFTFARPPARVVTLTRDGTSLRIDADGPVHLAFAGGRRLDVVAPATVTIPDRRR